jgi:hypothetical protein
VELNCKHTKCAICGGFRLKSAYVGNTKLSDICSPKCQMATKDACSCKCDGYFHKGSHKKEMDAILNPKKKKKVNRKKSVNKTTVKYLVSKFEPEGITDEIAVFLAGRKISKQSFTRFGDRNYIDRQLARNWITNDTKKGGKLDQLAMEYNNEYYRNLDESDVINIMVDLIIENPGGIKDYIKQREAEKKADWEAYNIRQDDEYFYVPEEFDFEFPAPAPEDLFINGIKNIKMKKLKKGSAEAKRFMAKIRSMKGKTTAKKSVNKSKVGYKDDRLSILKKGTKYMKKYKEMGYDRKDAIKNANLDASYVGATKLTEKELIKIASDYAYVTSSDQDRAIYRLTDPDFTNVLLPKYKKAIKDWEKKNKIKINVGGIKTKAKSRTTKKIKFNPKNLNANQDKYKYMNKYYEIHEDMDGEGYLSVPGGTIYFTGIGAIKKSKPMARALKTHKDTKSHNVNIRVVSGIGSYDNPEKIMQEIEYWQKVLDKLRNEYKSPKGKMYKSSITADIRLAKKWLELNKNKMKKFLVKIK